MTVCYLSFLTAGARFCLLLFGLVLYVFGLPILPPLPTLNHPGIVTSVNYHIFPFLFLYPVYPVSFFSSSHTQTESKSNCLLIASLD